MRKDNMRNPKSELVTLLESNIDSMKLSLSVEAIADRIQDMAERVAQIEAKDIMPLDSALRQVLGEPMAKKLAGQMVDASRTLLDALRTAKELYDEISAMVANPDDAKSDLMRDDGSDLGGDDFGDDAGVPQPSDADLDDLDHNDEPHADAQAQHDEIPTAQVHDDEEEHGGMGEAPPMPMEPGLGRERKESLNYSGRRLMEAFIRSRHPEAFVVTRFKKHMLEGYAPRVAAKIVARELGIDADEVKMIVTEEAEEKKSKEKVIKSAPFSKLLNAYVNSKNGKEFKNEKDKMDFETRLEFFIKGYDVSKSDMMAILATEAKKLNESRLALKKKF